ncbi:ISNCY family transposase ISDssp5 [subsurface metagenome]
MGLLVCVLEDQYRFILHHMVMEKTTDEKVAIPMACKAKEKFADLISLSFDKGFYSPGNRQALENILEKVILPKKGRLTIEEKNIEYSEDFIQGRRKHSAVESGINALENHGLDRCPDHAIRGFKRYVALAVLGRNLQNLGNIIQHKKFKIERSREPQKYRQAS